MEQTLTGSDSNQRPSTGVWDLNSVQENTKDQFKLIHFLLSNWNLICLYEMSKSSTVLTCEQCCFHISKAKWVSGRGNTNAFNLHQAIIWILLKCLPKLHLKTTSENVFSHKDCITYKTGQNIGQVHTEHARVNGCMVHLHKVPDHVLVGPPTQTEMIATSKQL